PTIIDNQPGYDTWLSADPGAIWDVDFKDELSKLASAYYKIHPGPNEFGTPLINWTTIFAVSGESPYTTYDTNWGLAIGDWELLIQGTSYVTVTAYDTLNNQTTSYDVFYIRKDTTPPYCVDNQQDIYASSQSDLDNIDVDFFDTGGSKLNYVQYRVAPSANNPTEYIIDWTNIATNINTTFYIQPWSIPFESLPNQATSYVSVRAVDFASLTTTFVDAFLIYKEAVGPSIIDNQPGDDKWRNNLVGVYYNIDFQSNSGANLDKFEIKITTAADGTGFEYTTWSVIVSNIGAVSYTANWQIQPDSYFFNNWPQGKNYVHVRVFDLFPSQATLNNAFHIMKDTAPPFVVDLQDGDTTWQRISGKTYNVDFQDYGIGVSTIWYRVYSSSITQNETTLLLDWTTIYAGAPVSAYTTDWQVDFDSLQEWATNYITVRCFDDFNYSVTSASVFFVLKDTTPPTLPTPSTPSDNALLSNQTVNFSWTASVDTRSGVDNYTLQISTISDFSVIYYSTITQSSEHLITISDGFYW
ncbi:MAG: hypothetical protein QME68_08160, partial [Elusimicrobiota bacterium]|nr:hypothetical protein [Elusimicrobiota bacterium]